MINKRYTLYLAAMFCLSMASCTDDVPRGIKTPVDENEEVLIPGVDDNITEEEIIDEGQLISSDLSVVASELNYKRGLAGPGMGGFYNTTQNSQFISDISSRGIDLYVGCHNYYREETPKYNELYNWQTGEYKAEICDLFVDIRVQAYQQGMEMVNIMGSCPKGYRVDPDYIFEDIDQPLPDDEKIEGETQSPMEIFQGVLPEYINMSEDEIGRRLGINDYHAIWCGSDEPAHSIGDPKDGTLDDAAKKANIERYIKFWEPIEKTIHAHGGKVGGLQLNSANANLYDYAVNTMKTNDLRLDYLTFIFYQLGKEKDFNDAIDALDLYNQKFNNGEVVTKMIILRGDYKKTEDISFCRFLIGERLCMENADKVHSYSTDCSTNYSSINERPTEWDCRFWIMTQLGDKSHSIEGLPENVDGFVTTKDNKVMAALWNFKDDNNDGICNEGLPTRTVSLELRNADLSENAKLKIRRFRGSDPVTQQVTEMFSKAKWDKDTNRVVNIELRGDEFVLIELG